MRRCRLSALVLAVLAATGCGESPPTGPRTDLNEAERKQVKELHDQRQKEWGGK